MDWIPAPQANGHTKTSSPFTVTRTAAITDSVVASAWTFNRRRLAAVGTDGSIQIWDKPQEGSGPWICSCKWHAADSRIRTIVWAPPEFGSKLAVGSTKGHLAVWRESREGGELRWRPCVQLPAGSADILRVAFSPSSTGHLLLAAASSDGQLRVYKSLDVLELREWQLQAEFSLVQHADELSPNELRCADVALSWNPSPDAGQPPALLIGSRGVSPEYNGTQVWELNERFGKWSSVADLSGANGARTPVNDVVWAPNMGRPYDLLAVGTAEGVDIWRLDYSREPNGRLPTQHVAHLTEHQSEVYQVEWDMTGWSLASAGNDGRVRVWQSSVGGDWIQQLVVAGRS